jgi:hypothetical protein
VTGSMCTERYESTSGVRTKVRTGEGALNEKEPRGEGSKVSATATIATIAQAAAVVSTCCVIILGIGAWKREFLGKRQIELAEETLAKFFEVRDAISFIRNPFSSTDEGKSRRSSERESSEESELLDRGYIVVERYSKRESTFAEFGSLKYRFMASFGAHTESIFTDTFKTTNSIFSSARMLATYYWPLQKRPVRPMNADEVQKHRDGMWKQENIFCDYGDNDDNIRKELSSIQQKLEQATAPCFREPMSSLANLKKKWRG